MRRKQIEEIVSGIMESLENPQDFLSEEARFRLRAIESEENKGYFEANYESLKRDYPGRWVAIFVQRVVAHDFMYGNIIKKLKKMNIDSGLVYVGNTSFKPRIQILSSLSVA